MTTDQDLSHDYERDVLCATFNGFAQWAEDQGITSKSELSIMPFPERDAILSEWWDSYVEDLQAAYMDSIENQRMKWSNA